MARTSRSTAGSRMSAQVAARTSTRRPAGRAGASKGQDAITLLKEDHVKVKDLLEKLEKATERSARRRVALLGQIETEIMVHATIEEEIFYPAFKEAATSKDGQEMFYEAHEEHHIVKVVLPEVRQADPSTPVFGARAKVLKELIEHHAEEEEKEMFKMAKKKIGKERLKELGAALAARKKELLNARRARG